MGAIAVGKRADFVVLNADHHALLGRSQDSVLDAWIFSGGNSCVRDVYVGGKLRVKDGAHVDAASITHKFKQTLARFS